MEAWAKYPRLVQQVSEGIKSSPDGFINLPSTALAVDELNRYLASFPGSTETWASSPEGAQDAVRFTRRFNAAKLAFPLVDIPSRLHEACPECELKTLLRTPPQKKFDRVTVTCQNPKCLHQLTEIEEEELI